MDLTITYTALHVCISNDKSLDIKNQSRISSSAEIPTEPSQGCNKGPPRSYLNILSHKLTISKNQRLRNVDSFPPQTLPHRLSNRNVLFILESWNQESSCKGNHVWFGFLHDSTLVLFNPCMCARPCVWVQAWVCAGSVQVWGQRCLLLWLRPLFTTISFQRILSMPPTVHLRSSVTIDTYAIHPTLQGF